MGHADRTMLYQCYGKYVEGIERDIDKIRKFFGVDFYTESKAEKLLAGPHGF